jgi:hypothetical protein
MSKTQHKFIKFVHFGFKIKRKTLNKYFLMRIIQLLPDHVANQIAAGELYKTRFRCQRLLENAVDAKASDIDYKRCWKSISSGY